MILRLLQTDRSFSSLLQRALLAAVVLPHGAQKLCGWFGGWGFSGTLSWFESALHVPAPLAALVVLSDFFGSLLLLAGAFTRVAAFGTVLTMLGAVFMVHAQNGFFMNWSGSQAGEGFEFHLLVLALALPLTWRGGGAFSLDSALATRLSEGASPRSSEADASHA